ncbi:MAG: glycosyltransferase family 9 protein, partial [Candidatus Kapaibacterium sp.]
MQPVPETPSSVLVIRLSSLGDVVLATPIVRAVRTRFPDARIDVAVAREYADVWHGNRNVTTVLELDKRRSAAHGLRRDAL